MQMSTLEEQILATRHYIGGGVYAKEWQPLKKGEEIEQHSHNFDHLSYLASGVVSVEVEGEQQQVYTGPTALLVKAHKKHKIRSLTPDVLWLCIHSIPADLRDAEAIEEALIAEKA